MADADRLRRPEERVVQVAAPAGEPTAAATILGRPAVAVLPFANMSGDPEQEYFADGLTEDILTALCAWRQFPVIARNSTFAYKGQAPDIRRVGTELGARYVLEGSVRKGGQRVRVTGQLIDAESGHHIWAERYDRDLSDIFELQDELTRRIVATLVPEVERAERERASTKPPENLDAWDCYLRGMAFYNDLSAEAIPSARALFERAIEIDPGYAKAYARLAMTYHRELRFNPKVDRAAAGARMKEAAEQAARLDDGDAMSHWTLSSCRILIVLAGLSGGNELAAVHDARRAVELNPADVDASFTLANALNVLGRADEALPYFEAAIRLSPRDPRLAMFQFSMARGCLDTRDYARAVEIASRVLARGGTARLARALEHGTQLILTAALGHMGRLAEAKALTDTLGRPEEWPMFPVYYGGELLAPARAHFLDGLRKAGMAIPGETDG